MHNFFSSLRQIVIDNVEDSNQTDQVLDILKAYFENLAHRSETAVIYNLSDAIKECLYKISLSLKSPDNEFSDFESSSKAIDLQELSEKFDYCGPEKSQKETINDRPSTLTLQPPPNSSQPEMAEQPYDFQYDIPSHSQQNSIREHDNHQQASRITSRTLEKVLSLFKQKLGGPNVTLSNNLCNIGLNVAQSNSTGYTKTLPILSYQKIRNSDRPRRISRPNFLDRKNFNFAGTSGQFQPPIQSDLPNTSGPISKQPSTRSVSRIQNIAYIATSSGNNFNSTGQSNDSGGRHNFDHLIPLPADGDRPNTASTIHGHVLHTNSASATADYENEELQIDSDIENQEDNKFMTETPKSKLSKRSTSSNQTFQTNSSSPTTNTHETIHSSDSTATHHSTPEEDDEGYLYDIEESNPEFIEHVYHQLENDLAEYREQKQKYKYKRCESCSFVLGLEETCLICS